MQFTMLYFILSEHVNRFQVRTLGNIDASWWPYYKADLAAGRTTEAAFREEFRHFIWQFGSIDNYWGHPMYLGGTKADGTTEYNPLSEVILDVIDQEALPTPKFQVKLAANTPDAIWAKALERGVDAFSTGMTYNYSAVGEVGFATCRSIRRNTRTCRCASPAGTSAGSTCRGKSRTSSSPARNQSSHEERVRRQATTLWGLRMFLGSNTPLMPFMRLREVSESDSARKGFFAKPIPCSPETCPFSSRDFA